MADTNALVLSIIQRTPGHLRSLTRGIDRDLLNAPLDSEWSLATLISHMIDVEALGFRQRIGRIIQEDNPLLPTINPADDADTTAGLPPFAVLLDAFEATRNDSLGWISTLDPNSFQRTGQHAAAGTITPNNIFHWWAIHDLAHIRQATHMLQSQLEPQLGNMSAFLSEI